MREAEPTRGSIPSVVTYAGSWLQVAVQAGLGFDPSLPTVTSPQLVESAVPNMGTHYDHG